MSDLGDILGRDVSAPEYELFTRWLDNLDRKEDLARQIEVGDGITEPMVDVELQRLESLVQQQPRVKAMMQRYKDYVSAQWSEFINRGLADPNADRRTFWMPHDILDSPVFGAPGSPGFKEKTAKSQRARKGTARDRNLSLIDVLERRFTDNLVSLRQHDLIQEMAAKYDLKRPGNQGQVLDTQGRALSLQSGDQIPEGFVLRDLRSGFFGKRWGSVADRTIEDVVNNTNLDMIANEYGINPQAFRQAMLQYGNAPVEGFAEHLGPTKVPKPPAAGMDPYMVIPKELDDAIQNSFNDAIVRRLRDNTLETRGTRLIKSGYLNFRPVRYNWNNLVGDIERAYAQFGNDFLRGEHWDAAWQAVRAHYGSGQTSPLMQKAIEYGVSSAGRVRGDMAATLSDPKYFKLQFPAHANSTDAVLSRVRSAFSKIPQLSAAREDLFRLAIMDMNIKRMSTGQQPLLGAADPAMVKGLMAQGGIDRTAAYIARQALGDYGDMTLSEDRLRGVFMPFYAWAKINTTFWPTVVKRALEQKKGGQLLAVGGLKAARGLATTALALTSVRVMNDLMWNEEEEQLPAHVRKSTHMIIPDVEHWAQTGEWQASRDSDGRLRAISIRDALDDFFSVLGLDTAIPEASSTLRGMLPANEYARRQVEGSQVKGVPGIHGPLNYVAQQAGPALQIWPALGGLRMFPDVFKAYQVAPEQRRDVLLDVLSLNTLGAGEALSGLGGDQLAQPKPALLNPIGDLGVKSYATPSILMDYGKSKYQADLIKKIEQVESDIRGIEGRMGRELSRESNRSLNSEQRIERFQRRYDMIKGPKVDELRRLSERLNALQRSAR